MTLVWSARGRPTTFLTKAFTPSRQINRISLLNLRGYVRLQQGVSLSSFPDSLTIWRENRIINLRRGRARINTRDMNSSDLEIASDGKGVDRGHPTSRAKNTIDEKRRMRNLRVKRKRKLLKKKTAIKELKNELKKEQERKEESERKVKLLKCMSRTYWERWHWELEKRKEAVRENVWAQKRYHSQAIASDTLYEINPVMLVDPLVNGKRMEYHIGRGSFAIVKLQYYRGIYVAVKRFLVHTVKEDVLREATILSKLCHPSLPFLFGICTTQAQYKIVMQFHGILKNSGSLPVTVRLYEEIKQSTIGITCNGYLIICAQLLEAIDYLHNMALILHNDIKSDNIVIEKLSETYAGCDDFGYNTVLIDFGKATALGEGRLYRLTPRQRDEYRAKYFNVAPEVIEGEHKQSVYSDMFSVGGVLYKICDVLQCKEIRSKVCQLAEQCRIPQYMKRLSAKQALLRIKGMVF